LEGGIGVLQAMRMSASVLSPVRRRALARAADLVATGIPLSEALLAHGLATTISTRLARVGESSGQLGAMLQRAAGFHDEENARWLERLSKVLEPALMAAIGAVIGGIVLLLYMPIFDLAGALP
jgi:general secretion pathway protein F